MLWYKAFKREKHNKIIHAIQSHKLAIQKTTEALDKAIAAFDGESDWFTCSCVRKGSENDNSNNNTCNDSSG